MRYYAIEQDTTYLVHYGVKGMKWGRRKSSSHSKNGSKGKQPRADVVDISDIRKQVTVKRKAQSKKKNTPENMTAKYKAGQSAFNSASQIATSTSHMLNKNYDVMNKHQRPDYSSMSDQEMRARINREKLEREYESIFDTPDVNRGRKIASNVLDIVGSTLAIGASTAGLALSIKQLKGK